VDWRAPPPPSVCWWPAIAAAEGGGRVPGVERRAAEAESGDGRAWGAGYRGGDTGAVQVGGGHRGVTVGTAGAGGGRTPCRCL
jgi:hypothetical protein